LGSGKKGDARGGGKEMIMGVCLGVFKNERIIEGEKKKRKT
jgi:hypothetical protein